MDETQYTPEELTAMLLQHVKDMTLAFGGKAIKDCVLTVPSFFTQHEKDALYTAAEIADLKVLAACPSLMLCTHPLSTCCNIFVHAHNIR